MYADEPVEDFVCSKCFHKMLEGETLQLKNGSTKTATPALGCKVILIPPCIFH
jgi:hypothetical protein